MSPSLADEVQSRDVVEDALKGNGNRARARSRWITVEPVLLFVALARKAMIVTRLQYLKTRISEEHHQPFSFGVTNSTTESLCAHANHTEVEDEIQRQTAVWSLYLYAISTFPAFFTTVFVGAISNVVGRKVTMLVPCVGFIVQCVLFLLISYFHFPLWTFYLAELLQGVSGGVVLLFAGAQTYIADTTNKKQRTLRIAVTEVVYFFGNGSSQISNGYLISYFGYESSYWLSLILLVLALLYAASPFILIETVDKNKDAAAKTTAAAADAAEGKGTGSTCSIFSLTNRSRSAKLVAAGCVLLFGLISVSGCQSVVVLHGLAEPFCWSALDVGFFSAASLVLPGVGSIIGGQLVYYFSNDYWMMYASLFSAMAMSMVTAFAKTTTVLYISVVAGAMSSFIAPLVRGLMSKMVDEHEQASVFTYGACIGNTVKFIAKVMSFGVYAHTVHTLPTLTFYVLAGVPLIPIVLTFILHNSTPTNFETTMKGVARDIAGSEDNTQNLGVALGFNEEEIRRLNAGSKGGALKMLRAWRREVEDAGEKSLPWLLRQKLIDAGLPNVADKHFANSAENLA
ncbi:proton-coupled folate transporter-like [Diadema setosum]|uniref:proton-coupled folate transporter-like n=1 Tax=Diadema setosum TaxID=31175 RepID=UPI003B3A29EB